MIVRTLTLRNFRRYRALDLELPDGVVALVGPNGSGKSTILEAILFGLFGGRALRTVKDQVRHAAAGPSDDVLVELSLEAAGHAITIRRLLRGRAQAPDATVTVDGNVAVQPGGGSAEAATVTIERLLGLDLEGFRSTVVAQQKELGRLAEMGSVQRKQQVLSMMGIDRLDRAIQDARGRRRSVHDQLEGLRRVLGDPDSLRAALATQEAAAASAAHRIQEAQVAWDAEKRALAGVEEEILELRRQADQRAAIEARRAAAEAEASRCRVVLDHAQRRMAQARQAEEEATRLAPWAALLDAAEKRLDEARDAHRRAAQRNEALARLGALERRLESARKAAGDDLGDDPTPLLVTVREEAAVVAQRLQAARARHARLGALGSDAPCPTCERPLQGHLGPVLSAVHAEVTELEQEHEDTLVRLKDRDEARRRWQQQAQARAEADRVAAAVEQARASLPPLEPDPPDLRPLEEACRDARTAEKELAAAQRLAAAGKEARREAEQALAAVTAATQAADEARSELGSLPELPSLAAIDARAAAARRRERDAEAALRRAEQDLALAADRVVAARERLAAEEERRQQAQTLEDELRHWTALAGPRGGLLDAFRDHLTDRIGPALAQEAGRLLAAFTGGRYDEVLLDQDYALYVSDGGDRYSLERFSGGEVDVVHLALRLAVSRLLADRSGTELRFLALDEVFGSLDAHRRGHVVAALERLGGLYGQVLVVTHLDELRDALDHTVEVVEEDGEARVVLHKG